MLNGIHGHQDIERVVYGRPAGPALRAEAERLGARRVFVTTSKSVAQSVLLAEVIRELGDRYAGVYAGYYFNSDDNAPLSGSATPILLPTQFVHGWSARVTSGVDMMVLGGTRLSLGGELGGLGNDFTVWSVQVRAAVPF